ncbi:OmpW/AlkL family protein [Bombella saccharophila]|uniref:Outer membrane beta-barrel protein n=1 Tax=Bombella saccharophila TaxID=2967338 RepID=A0ABT3W8B2_9PROT|nr:OmpW family outer membrane protein [Bombella saccharophila]MCX5614565.1 outer membrane beta-barrel protein [Bombella saccharophila]PHI96802.1 hypothetical protein BG621_03495 [Parasaccharibacter apium]
MSRTFTRMAAAALFTFGATSFGVAKAAASAPVTASTTMQAAPDASVHLQPPASEHCGLFKTCANTKIGLGKGDFVVRLSALGVITNNTGSRVRLAEGSPAAALAGGNTFRHNVSVTNQVMPELTLEYFLTNHISLDLIASSTRHEAAAHVGNLGKLDAGSFWILPPTLTAAYHFRPNKRFNPYAGLGITVAIFHNMHPAQNLNGIGNGAVFDAMHMKTNVGPSFNLGFDYQLVGNWFFNFDIKQILLFNQSIHLSKRNNGITGGRVHVHDDVHPTVVGAGIEYRF